MNRNWLSWETEAKVIKLYRETSANGYEIAATLSLSGDTVTKILRRNLPPEEYAALKKTKKRRRNVLYLDPTQQGTRQCRICLEILDVVEFQWKPGIQTFCRGCQKRRSKANSDRRRQTIQGRYYSYKKDAEVRDLEFDIEEYVFASFWKRPCCYCKKIVDTVGLDRLDNNVGYLLSNVVSCCMECNYIKKKMSYSEFVNYCRRVVEIATAENRLPDYPSGADHA